MIERCANPNPTNAVDVLYDRSPPLVDAIFGAVGMGATRGPHCDVVAPRIQFLSQIVVTGAPALFGLNCVVVDQPDIHTKRLRKRDAGTFPNVSGQIVKHLPT